MKKKLLYKAAWLGATLFFLLIAWATTVDDELLRNNLPFSIQLQERSLTIINESDIDYADLTVVLNAVYTLEGVDLAAGSSIQLPLNDFSDRHGSLFPGTENPHKLEIYYNGQEESAAAGYLEYFFE